MTRFPVQVGPAVRRVKRFSPAMPPLRVAPGGDVEKETWQNFSDVPGSRSHKAPCSGRA